MPIENDGDYAKAQEVLRRLVQSYDNGADIDMDVVRQLKSSMETYNKGEWSGMVPKQKRPMVFGPSAADEAEIARGKSERLPDLRAPDLEGLNREIFAKERELSEFESALSSLPGAPSSGGAGGATGMATGGGMTGTSAGMTADQERKTLQRELEALRSKRRELGYDEETGQLRGYQPEVPGARIAGRLKAATDVIPIVGPLLFDAGLEASDALSAAADPTRDYDPGQASGAVRKMQDADALARGISDIAVLSPAGPSGAIGRGIARLTRGGRFAKGAAAGAGVGALEGLAQDELESVERGQGLRTPSAKAALQRAAVGGLSGGLLESGPARAASAVAEGTRKMPEVRTHLEAGGSLGVLGPRRGPAGKRAAKRAEAAGTDVENELATEIGNLTLDEALRRQTARKERHRAETEDFYTRNANAREETTPIAEAVFDNLMARVKRDGSPKAGERLSALRDLRERFLGRTMQVDQQPRGTGGGREVTLDDLRRIGFTDEDIGAALNPVSGRPAPSAPARSERPAPSSGSSGAETQPQGYSPESIARTVPGLSPESLAMTRGVRPSPGSVAPTRRVPVEAVESRDLEILPSSRMSVRDSELRSSGGGPLTTPESGPRTDAATGPATRRDGDLSSEELDRIEARLRELEGDLPPSPRTEPGAELMDEWVDRPEGTMRSMTESQRMLRNVETQRSFTESARQRRPANDEVPGSSSSAPTRRGPPAPESARTSGGGPEAPSPSPTPRSVPPPEDYEYILRGARMNPKELDDLANLVDRERLGPDGKPRADRDPALDVIAARIRAVRDRIPGASEMKHRQEGEIAAAGDRQKLAGLPKEIPEPRAAAGGAREGRSAMAGTREFQDFVQAIKQYKKGGKPLSDEALLSLARESGADEQLRALAAEHSYRSLSDRASIRMPGAHLTPTGGGTYLSTQGLGDFLRLRGHNILESTGRPGNLSGRGGRLTGEIVAPNPEETERRQYLERLRALLFDS